MLLNSEHRILWQKDFNYASYAGDTRVKCIAYIHFSGCFDLSGCDAPDKEVTDTDPREVRTDDVVHVPFNKPAIVGTELTFASDCLGGAVLSGGGRYGIKCERFLGTLLGAEETFLTPSCTASLEMSALLLGIAPGDEVIMPSFTFVSTANAFSLFGANIVFVDIRPDTMNMDEKLIEAAITPRTKAIVPVHYGGVACEMKTILEISRHHGVAVVEDAAQAIGATYHGRPLGGIGDIGVFSFHESKNITSGGEGGLTAVNRIDLTERADVVRQKGTNRSLFARGKVDKYTWVDRGSSYLMNEVSAAFLWAQIEALTQITQRRRKLHKKYEEAFGPLIASEKLQIQYAPDGCSHNGHLFYLKLRDEMERSSVIAFLRKAGVDAVFHYVPLHSSEAGKKFGRFVGEDKFTSQEAARLIRLPLFYDMTDEQHDQVCDALIAYFRTSS